MNIDLHVHTRASACSNFYALELAWAARVEEHPVVVTTNHHDSLGDNEELYAECARFGLLYLPAMEMTTDWGDFLLYGENLDDFHGRFRDFPTDRLPRPHVAVVWAHPYEFFTERYVDSIKDQVAPHIDAVEVLNGKCMITSGSSANHQAAALAAELGKTAVAGSDAHSKKRYFTAWTEFLDPVNCYGDLVTAIKMGRVKMPDLALHLG
jgi:predicted metal-dependent phosphoesterase TrpH